MPSHVEGAEKLIKITLDIGEEKPRTVFAGIKSAYDAGHPHRQAHRDGGQPGAAQDEVRGLSEGMILAASDSGGQAPRFVHPGSRTRAPLPGIEGKVSNLSLVTFKPSSQCSPSHTIVNSRRASRDAGSSSRACITAEPPPSIDRPAVRPARTCVCRESAWHSPFTPLQALLLKRLRKPMIASRLHGTT